MLPWAHQSPHPIRNLDRFSRFCRAHYCDRPTNQPTDRQTNHATRSVTIGRITATHGRFSRIRQVPQICTPHIKSQKMVAVATSSAPVDSHLTHDALGPFEPTSQTESRSVQPFLHSSPHSVPILYNGTPLSPLILPLPMGGSGPPSNTWFPGPTRVHNPNGISIGPAVFAWLTSVTERQTDKQTDTPRS